MLAQVLSDLDERNIHNEADAVWRPVDLEDLETSNVILQHSHVVWQGAGKLENVGAPRE